MGTIGAVMKAVTLPVPESSISTDQNTSATAEVPQIQREQSLKDVIKIHIDTVELNIHIFCTLCYIII